MLEAPSFDKMLGMFYYATDTCPSGGVIKRSPEDFVVEEVLLDGTVIATSGVELRPRVGNWTWIHVVKRNVDTIRLVLRLARALGLSHRDVSVGGLKDTKAVTSQIISVRGPVANLPQLPGVQFLGMWSMDKPITPSQIYGNRFTIILRDVERISCAEGALEALKKTAAPNYYGYQRFGTIRPVTHLLGKALLKKDPHLFFEVMFCKIFSRESEVAKRAREAACKGDYAKALELFPKKFVEERVFLKRLAGGYDMWNAIMAIPPQILRVYIEAAQSYIFNRFLSIRMEIGPIDRPVEGDLVEINGQIAYYAEGLGGEVVLPVVGAGVRMPRGKVGEALLRVLREEGLDPSAFLKMPRGLRVYGTYRRVRLEPAGFEYKIMGNDVFMQFTLPRGSYATVLLREVVKPAEPHKHGF
ncbi:tRNA pseudouridine(13) synthase TruD [Pyrobaculum aerophilum]|uniref:tRNA pseudouridine(13) synthase TruD n=1 Tax=Pyrobaculum aerophilum TaxID=13773 RepID=UPI0023F2FBA9|nr:tRNA pseudouridine(13) synthase TruD [Pyrobaculum aerophilum]MCX8136551.1 tRNA pseudouridine(13) synthase TruD [Pyrobaculum aerophilum]